MKNVRSRFNLESLDDRIVPAVVSPDLLLSLPPINSASTGNNASVATSAFGYGSGSGSSSDNAYGSSSGSGSGSGFLSANDSYPNNAYGTGSGDSSPTASASLSGSGDLWTPSGYSYSSNAYGSGSGSGSADAGPSGDRLALPVLLPTPPAHSTSSSGGALDSSGRATDPTGDAGYYTGPDGLPIWYILGSVAVADTGSYPVSGVSGAGSSPGVGLGLWDENAPVDTSLDLSNGPGANDIMVDSGVTLMANEPPPHHGAMGSYLKIHAEDMAREEDMRRQQAIQDRNGHIRTIINANQNWTQAETDKITARVVELAEASQFRWAHSTGTFGDCDKWVNEYLSRTGNLQSKIIADGLRGYIDVGPAGWNNKYFEWLGAGHAAVRIALSDGTEFFLDDGNIGGSDHMFTADEVPGKYIPYHVVPLFPKRP